MTFTIHKESEPPRVIRMGHAPEPLTNEPEGVNMETDRETINDETGGPEKIREDDAGEQGAVGSHGKNAPAQTKTPKGDGKKEE